MMDSMGCKGLPLLCIFGKPYKILTFDPEGVKILKVLRLITSTFLRYR